MGGTRAKTLTYAGLFVLTLATLMYETLLTRIFSVTMWYHFAFVAISVALFGMTAGAILVYLLPRYFTPEKTRRHLALSALWFSITIVLSFLSHLSIPFVAQQTLRFQLSLTELYSIAFTYAILTVPFVFSGIAVCLLMTRFPRQVSVLYAADLAGAALGCIAVIYVLRVLDGPTAVILVAVLAGLAALLFTLEARMWRLGLAALACCLLFAGLVAFNTARIARGYIPVLRIAWVKGQPEQPPLYERWNSFSRVQVVESSAEPFGWGLSPTYPRERTVQQLFMYIDAVAGTPLTYYNHNDEELQFLKYDVTNVAHHLRQDADVLAIGPGGGRDILTALIFEQKSVVGVEINEEIVRIVNKKYGDFTGHLDQDPRVTFVVDEARSYTARSEERFDIIQVSLIDTWAATAAGAFALSESSLYTVEAWTVFWEHLTPEGILTFSRWYYPSRPAEMYRLTALATDVLQKAGVTDPRRHIILVKCPFQWAGAPAAGPDEVGTILVSREPFSEQDIDTVEAVARQMQFDVVLSPRFALDETFATIASGQDLASFTANYPLDITPPTDDSPFFFFMLRFKDTFNAPLAEHGVMTFNLKAVVVLGTLLVTVVVLTVLCFIVPLALTTDKSSLRGAWPLSLFFACIGLGFMLVEISQMQRLIIFLGHPTYSLSVVLFSLLLSSGVGSFLTNRIGNPARSTWSALMLLFLVAVVVLFGLVTPYAIQALEGAVTELRILVAVGILAPLGLLMGMAFPLGMKLASARAAAITPWLWGLNGATSVLASVLAVVIALGWRISTAFWTGAVCYALAAAAFAWARRRRAA